MRYEIKPSEFSSHSEILKAVGEGRGRSLLDVGSADGQMSTRFVQMGWRVTAVEPDAADAASARARGIDVLQMSLEESLDLLEDRFATVVLADVLEHCADPWEQLLRIVRVCEPGASIVISLPNVAHVVPRARLLSGRFDYEDRGIMDRTHLRFFTRRTALEMVKGAGLTCETMQVTPTPVELVFPRLIEGEWGRRLLALNAGIVRFAPRLLAYQFIMVCRVPEHSG